MPLVPAQIRVCFVCLGNICRSPTAEGVFRSLVAQAGLSDRIVVDSAGTGAHHEGEPPDPRSTAAAAEHGVTLTGRARLFSADDFERFDYVVAMDRDNYEALRRLTTASDPAPVMLLDFDPASENGIDVPDPYYAGRSGFANVFDLCRAGSVGLLATLRQRHGL